MTKRWLGAVAAVGMALALILGSGIGTAYAQPVPVLTITPSSSTFGPVAVGDTASKTFVLTNEGGSATGALTITISGAPEFTITANTCRGALGPGGSCEVTVQFAPTATTASTVTATLNVAGTRPEARASATLTGTVAAAVIPIPVDCSTGANLQTAINQAPAGATLAVTGTCFGNFFVPRNLTISGHKGATLNGNQQGSVLRVEASVTLNTLIITNGRNGTFRFGGGIYNSGTVTLNDSTVTGNEAAEGGGGIYNLGMVTLNDGSTVSKNVARVGGGISSSRGRTVTLNDSTITGNEATGFAGGIYNLGPLTLNGSTITGNEAFPLGGGGGGILNDESTGKVTLNGSTITGNKSPRGGGIYNLRGGEVTLNSGTTVTGNEALTPGGSGGGGIFNDSSTVTMNGGVIRGNDAIQGGGIRNLDGLLLGVVCGQNVLDNIPNNVSPPIPGQSGC